MQTTDNRKGMVYMLAAVACFTTTDVLMKVAAQSLPVSQVLALRGALALAMVAGVILAWRAPVSAKALVQPHVLLRTALESAMIAAYLTALSRAPIADVFSVLQSSPIIATAAAAIFFGEKVGAARWAAIVTGFLGMALIVRPSPQGFDVPMGLAFLAAVLVAGRDLTTRAIPAWVPTTMATLTATFGTMAAGLALAPFQPWLWPTTPVWGIVLAAAITVGCGNYCIIVAYRAAEASFVAPFRYVGVPLAIVLGYLVWGEAPDALAGLGAVLIAGAGVYTMRRQSRRA